MLKCKYCQKECKSENSLRNHERCCPHNPTRVYKNGMTGKKGKNQYSLAKELGIPIPPAWNKGLPGTFANKRHTDETKQKISKKLSINNKGGRSKWYDVAGQRVQGTWERDIALKLEELTIKWIKLKTNKDTLEYVMDGKIRRYTPDFYLPEFEMYFEIKGFWWGNDKEKMSIVLNTYPDKRIVIIEELQFKQIMLL